MHQMEVPHIITTTII